MSTNIVISVMCKLQDAIHMSLCGQAEMTVRSHAQRGTKNVPSENAFAD